MRAVIAILSLIALAVAARAFYPGASPQEQISWKSLAALEEKFRPDFVLEESARPYLSEVAVWKEKLRLDPKNHIAAARLGAGLFSLARISSDEVYFREAEAQLEKLKALELADSCSLSVLYARSLMSRHEFQQALEIAERSEIKCPESEAVRGLLADASFGLGDYEKALTNASLLSAGAARDVRLAEFALLEGNQQLALSTFANVLKETPRSSIEPSIWIRLRIGIVYLKAGNLEAAEYFFRATLALAPDYFLGIEHLAEVMEEREDWAKAKPLLEQALALQEKPEIFLRLSEVEQNLGNTEISKALRVKGLAALEQSARQNPAEARPYIEHLLDEETNLAEALRLAEADWKMRPGDLKSNLILAKACRLNAKPQCAKEHIEAAAAFGKPSTEVLAERELILDL